MPFENPAAAGRFLDGPPGRWHRAPVRGIADRMRHPSSSNAGGFLVAIGVLLGAGIGLLYGQATPGALIGLLAGAFGAIVLWQLDRRR